jgi:hypothetical protein
MADESRCDEAATAMRRINQTWLDGRVDDLAPLLHPDIVMVFPGFAGKVRGREEFLAGFRDFCQNAMVEELLEHDDQVDVVGNTAMVTFRYEMLYKRAGERYRVCGRDFWAFQIQDGTWIAVWRTMFDTDEKPA